MKRSITGASADSISDMFDDVLKYFKKICSIPHGSGNTKGISSFCVDFAKKEGLRHHRDEAGNVIIFVPASDGRRNDDSVILQGHLDMVCAKSEDCPKDLSVEPLELIQSDDFLEANGTSLGGDDGIAIAYCLALAENRDSFSHPPLELVFTVDEEVGMDGAKALDCSVLNSKIMINIDNEDENSLIVSCAGGLRIDAKKSFAFSEEEQCVCVSLFGFSGGHSGTEIANGHENAIISLCNALKGSGTKLHSIFGGDADNAIPSSCRIVFSADGSSIEAIKRNIRSFLDSSNEPNAGFEIQNEAFLPVVSAEESEAIFSLISSLPNGVVNFSEKIKGLPETSLNLGIAELRDGDLRISHSIRSSDESEKRIITERVFSAYFKEGFDVSSHGEYPAWEYRDNSPLREIVTKEFESLTGRKMKVEAIHAGLECGIFSSKIKDLDCVSIGPNMSGIHTPNEKLDLKSAALVFDILLKVLKRAGRSNEN